MFDFICKACGEEFTADPGKFWYEQDGDTIVLGYIIECPHCEHKHKCREIFRWDGFTIVE